MPTESIKRLFARFPETMRRDFEDVDQALLGQLNSDVVLASEVSRYIVDSGGKRLRAMLVLLTAGACGYRDRLHIPLAAAFELLHTATLLHDDVIDMSSMRRNRLSANVRWNNQSSILVGDFLYSRAFQLLASTESMGVMRLLSNVSNQIAEGELMQMESLANLQFSESRYMEIIRRKTAILFEAAASSGALLARADQALQETMSRYGLEVGMAFQLIDDAMDYDGDEEKIGKCLGDDLAEGKFTLPLIYALKNGKPQQRQTVERAFSMAKALPPAEDSEEKRAVLSKALEAVLDCGGAEYARDQARVHFEHAQAALDGLPEGNPWREPLSHFAKFILQRDS